MPGVLTCPHCGAETGTDVGWSYCGKCGKRVAAPSAGTRLASFRRNGADSVPEGEAGATPPADSPAAPGGHSFSPVSQKRGGQDPAGDAASIPAGVECVHCKHVNDPAQGDQGWGYCQGCGKQLSADRVPSLRAHWPPPPDPATTLAANLNCPHCGVENPAGAWVYCQTCGKRLTPEPWSRTPEGPSAVGWHLVRRGLSILYWATLAFSGASIAYVGLAIVVVAALAGGGRVPPLDEPPFSMVLLTVAGTILIAFIAATVGQCLCCTAPDASGARSLAFASVSCLFAGLLLAGGLVWMSVAQVQSMLAARAEGLGRAPDYGGAFFTLAGFLAALALLVASHVLLALFVRNVARFFRREALAQSVRGYLTAYFIVMGLNLVLNVIQTVIRDRTTVLLVGFLALTLLAFGIIVLVWYLRLLAGARDCIQPGDHAD
jgi:hypothetical protein